MLYECLECNHKISVSASRCPNCGAEDAGSIAHGVAWDREQREREQERKREEQERERDRDSLDPGWREREKAKRLLTGTIVGAIVGFIGSIPAMGIYIIFFVDSSYTPGTPAVPYGPGSSEARVIIILVAFIGTFLGAFVGRALATK